MAEEKVVSCDCGLEVTGTDEALAGYVSEPFRVVR